MTRGVKRSVNASMKMSTQSNAAPIATAITECINDSLHPIHLEVINESYMHNVPKGSETHFKVLVVRISFHFSYSLSDFSFRSISLNSFTHILVV